MPSMVARGSGGLGPFLVAELVLDPRPLGVEMGEPSDDMPELHIVLVVTAVEVFKLDFIVSCECGGHGRHPWRLSVPALVAVVVDVGPRLTAR